MGKGVGRKARREVSWAKVGAPRGQVAREGLRRLWHMRQVGVGSMEMRWWCAAEGWKRAEVVGAAGGGGGVVAVKPVESGVVGGGSAPHYR